MLFHEIYSLYYQTVAKILGQAVEGKLTGPGLLRLVWQTAFPESSLRIPQALESGEWPLLEPDFRTPLCHAPEMPLTLLEKRWLKSLLLDPRIRLFSPSEQGLEEVTPLYRPEDIVYFDRYGDGDPYGDPAYQAHFHTILQALREKRRLWVRFRDRHGKPHGWDCIPDKLEYSSKDDKFRLLVFLAHRTMSVNLARVEECRVGEPCAQPGEPPAPADGVPQEREKEPLVLELKDDRNALERVMLHFSHLEKEAWKLDGGHYRLRLSYYREDETDILIRVLSFGPLVQVIAPDSFREQIRERLCRQRSLGV